MANDMFPKLAVFDTFGTFVCFASDPDIDTKMSQAFISENIPISPTEITVYNETYTVSTVCFHFTYCDETTLKPTLTLYETMVFNGTKSDSPIEVLTFRYMTYVKATVGHMNTCKLLQAGPLYEDFNAN